MILKIKNIGKIHKEAEIEIDGITIISGINGTGKSTIGKCLYTIYSSFYDLSEKINFEKCKYIRRIINSNAVTANAKSFSEILVFSNHLIDDYINGLEVDVCERVASELGGVIDTNDIDAVSEKVEEALKMPDEEIIKMIFEDKLFSEFANNCINVNYYDETAEMGIELKNGKIKCRLFNGAIDRRKEFEIEKDIDITKNITYIADMSILDQLSNNYSPMRYSFDTHEVNLLNKLRAEQNASDSVISGAIANKRVNEVVAKLNAINVGSLVKTGTHEYGYTADDLDGSIDLINVSAGLKELVVLKQLIMNGAIEENGILIFDEPEIHLHPEWQNVLAEVIVVLQKEFNLNILISTHSADFLSFIELYSKKYLTNELCKYYLIENESRGCSVVRNVTDNIDEIYKRLGELFIRASEELNESDDN